LSSVLDRRETADLFGIAIDRLTMDETVARIREMVRERGLHQHVVVNAAKIVALGHDPELLDVIRSCDMVNADGMSVVWASRLLGDPLPERVAGIDLFDRLVRTASEDGTSVYFLGATEEVVEEVAAVYTRRYPGLRVAGYRNGYWDDDQAVVAAVRACAPDYLFLAIPSPRKEFWVRDHLEALGTPFVMGVGGSFDVIAGKVARAPRWAQQTGFEWAWRLAQEPGRMWRRYLYTNSAFVRTTVRAWLRNRA
jgi:N-acetylglucosaminyldiphosphoundecaprenol N-acetyl-beta-D-mannosaminyltransferase